MNFILGFLGNIGTGIASWAVGGVVRSFVETELKKHSDNLKEDVISKIKSDVNKVDDEDLQEMARYAVRYVAKNFPDIDNSEKLQKAIKTLQSITPPVVDFFLSDAALRGIIEAAYRDIKKELSNI